MVEDARSGQIRACLIKAPPQACDHMRIIPFTLMIGVLLATTFNACASDASGGSIQFSGAVVEPTCGVTTMPVATHEPRQMSCATSGRTATGTAVYSSTIERLSGVQADKVLQYFDNYVQEITPGGMHPELVTQTYE